MRGQEDVADEREETIRLQREQIERLQEKIRRLEEELALYRQLAEELPRLREQVEELSHQKQGLEDRLKKNSQNSSLPPSSDRFARHKRSLRDKSG